MTDTIQIGISDDTSDIEKNECLACRVVNLEQLLQIITSAPHMILLMLLKWRGIKNTVTCARHVPQHPDFFADNYCYHCDSSETPIASTAEEQASCTKCPNRTINSDNQCVLIQTEE